MHIAGHAYSVLSPSEIELIHRSALRILAEMGMEVQNDELLQILAEHGLRVDFQAQRVRFPPKLVEDYIATAGKYDWENASPRISSPAGVYHGLFHNPATNVLVPWTEERLAYYFRLAPSFPMSATGEYRSCGSPVGDRMTFLVRAEST